MSDPGQDQKQPEFADLSGAQSRRNGDGIGPCLKTYKKPKTGPTVGSLKAA